MSERDLEVVVPRDGLWLIPKVPAAFGSHVRVAHFYRNGVVPEPLCGFIPALARFMWLLSREGADWIKWDDDQGVSHCRTCTKLTGAKS